MKGKCQHGIVAAWLFVSAGASFAESLDRRLNQYIEQALRQFSVPSVSVVVVDQDSVLYAQTFSANKQGRAPVYYIGSVSKTLTALAVLRLVEMGQLSLDHEMMRYLPGLAWVGMTKQPTVRHLLNHSSGLSRLDGFMNVAGLDGAADEQVVIRLHSKPGEQYQYSNLNYVLLGMIIEEVSGMAYADFLAAAVFKPVAMNHSSADCSQSKELLTHHQYWGVPKATTQGDYHRLSVPAGFLCSSAIDLGRLLQLNLNQGHIKGQQLFSESTIKTMHTVWNGAETGYAMGWRRVTFNGQPMLQHLGSTATSVSGMFLFPEASLGVVVLSNSNSLWFTESLMAGILALVTNEQPAPVSGFEFYFRLTILAAVVLLVLSCLYQLIKAFRARSTINRSTSIRKLLIQVVLIVVVVLVFPYVAGIPLQAMIRFQPDIAALMVLSLVAPLLVAGWQLILALKATAVGSSARSKKEAHNANSR